MMAYSLFFAVLASVEGKQGVSFFDNPKFGLRIMSMAFFFFFFFFFCLFVGCF